MNPGNTSVAICSRTDCSTESIGRSALPDTALSTSAYRLRIAITSCATAYTVSSNTSDTPLTAWASASSSGSLSTRGSSRLTAASCKSSTKSAVERYGALASMSASAPSHREEIRSDGRRRESSSPAHRMSARGLVVAPALCSRFACWTIFPCASAAFACRCTTLRADAAASCANCRCSPTRDLPVPSTLTAARPPCLCPLPCRCWDLACGSGCSMLKVILR